MAPISEKLANRLAIAAMAMGFALLIAMGFGVNYVVQRNQDFTDLVTHTYEVQRTLGDFRIHLERSETARRGYLLSGASRFRDVYEEAQAAQSPILQRLAELTRDNPVQQGRIAQMRVLLAEQKAAQAASMRAGAVGGRVERFADDPAVATTRAMRNIANEMDASEQRLMKQRNAERMLTVRNLVALMVAAGIVLGIVGVGSLWIILLYTRDLNLNRAELRHLNAGLEAAVAERTADLQRANDEIQRFAYIVSHDLRSPLVNVMGFTSELEAAAKPMNALVDAVEEKAPELLEQDARRAVREDLPEAIGFIRSSTQKMDRLINAILKLSREGRRVLAPEMVDMSSLMGGIADTLKHRSDELGADIRIAPHLPDLVSDRLALEQVFSNIIENALKYLKAGRPGEIEVSGRRDGPRVIYEVKDNGRGVDPRDHERIFDLFRRSGVQDQPGEGIGLAHTRALIYRLGGTISVDSALDQGATFRVMLPARLSSEGAAT